MKIRSLGDLEERLSEDLIWRKKELTDLKSLIENCSFSPSKQNAVLRSGVALLYAHWEGYIKIAASSYLEFVSRQQLTYEELAINFVAIAMKNELDRAQSTNKATIYTEVTAFILTQANQRSSIPYEGIVSTNANLSSTVLREITCLLGLNHSFYQSKDKIIDEKLLSRRNKIAHGESLPYLSLDRGEYQYMQEEILAMMEDFRTQVENNASQRLFCRTI
jgi:MAE_28990/MAE_18760-like HEPN